MTEERDKLLAKLREPFPEGSVGILPKPYKKDSPKGNCNVCKGYHGLPAAHLDFVGHAAVTDRLLSIDPEWSWEPFALDERGLPALDKNGNLWIRLTVLGITRPGVGDGFSMKEIIGDAIRNAAMRFGVALSLWSKDELESGLGESKATTNVPAPAAPPAQDRKPDAVASEGPGTSSAVSTMGLRAITEALQAAGLSLAGNTEAKRQRLAEHLAAPADPETGEMAYAAGQESFV